MDNTVTELLARVEILEDEVKQLREYQEGFGVVFEMDMDELAPELALFFTDDDGSAH